MQTRIAVRNTNCHQPSTEYSKLRQSDSSIRIVFAPLWFYEGIKIKEIEEAVVEDQQSSAIFTDNTEDRVPPLLWPSFLKLRPVPVL